jgi:hypothetical protein
MFGGQYRSDEGTRGRALRVDAEQRSTKEKDLSSERAHLRERMGVLDGEEKKIQRGEKK